MEHNNLEVTLEVLNPQGEIFPPQTFGLSPSLSDLNGKTVALMDNWKHGTDYLEDAFETLLREQYSDIKIIRKRKPEGKPGGGRLVWSADAWYEEVASQCDAFIYTIGD